MRGWSRRGCSDERRRTKDEGRRTNGARSVLRHSSLVLRRGIWFGQQKEARAMNSEEARALVERQARAWERADLAAIMADFAPDGALISPGGRWQGYDALRHAAESVFEAVTVQVVVTRVLLEGDQGAAEWTWTET